ncbi:33943_t:CDS:1 [Racocetra persica]|uniref:33943_t:CDS:1 n=1 Tax=Racocetra persica TaxID=160502 RepID=A0ACA9PTJ8_9GLOM|nr:33943_t:CDS:1 [Racocetra persica]
MLLNKIRVVGKVLPLEYKEKSLTKELLIYFSLLVTNPNGVHSLLRCHTSGKAASALKEQVVADEIIEVKGYLRNEKKGRQIIIQVVEFSKLEDIPDYAVNQVRLLGRVISDYEMAPKENLFSFKLEVPTKENPLNTFFCRAHDELATEMAKQVRKNDLILLEGFLQTKKLTSPTELYPEKITRISSLICQSFVLLDTVTVNNFYPWNNLVLISKETKKIDFTKPKETD